MKENVSGCFFLNTVYNILYVQVFNCSDCVNVLLCVRSGRSADVVGSDRVGWHASFR